MKTKKTEKADLENKKLLFVEVGLIASLVLVWLGFEYSTSDVRTVMLDDNQSFDVEEIIIPANLCILFFQVCLLFISLILAPQR